MGCGGQACAAAGDAAREPEQNQRCLQIVLYSLMSPDVEKSVLSPDVEKSGLHSPLPNQCCTAGGKVGAAQPDAQSYARHAEARACHLPTLGSWSLLTFDEKLHCMRTVCVIPSP